EPFCRSHGLRQNEGHPPGAGALLIFVSMSKTRRSISPVIVSVGVPLQSTGLALPTASKRDGARLRAPSVQPCRSALLSANLASACSNLALKSHIASRISRKVADDFARSARPKVKTLLLRRYPMIVGSEIT